MEVCATETCFNTSTAVKAGLQRAKLVENERHKILIIKPYEYIIF